ncbi:PHP domain-containing protein [Photobacterium leiognathi]|uniref:PHP domain-containing protein n=1 Tax=Photobacterium leiognathi TaxID=553611 RepID=UPI001EE012E2|nr:PHP domain-containing protein [Photobacterium leiognathi]MCG3884898.1 PHP domain-containing protein [Photobacterium leiognathi]
MPFQGFVHLNVHADFSIKDSLIKVPALIKSTSEMSMPAVAITDLSNLHGSIKVYKGTIGSNVKPIIDAELNLYNDEGKSGLLYVYCKNLIGYKNLLKLTSMSYKDGRDVEQESSIKPEWVTKNNFEGLIAISGGRTSIVGQYLLADDLESA